MSFRVVPFIACIVLSAACEGSGQDAGPRREASLCAGFEQLTLDRPNAPKDEQIEAARDLLGDDVPVELAGPASVLDDPSSSTDERNRALDEIGEWFVVECGRSGDEGIRLVPTEVPGGLDLCSAFDLPAVEPEPDPSTPTIWGDASLDDPWAGPLAGIWTTEADELYGHDDAEDVTVHGVRGSVAPMPLFQAVSSAEWGHIVTWRDPSGRVIEVAARGASPPEAVQIAELVEVGSGAPSLPADALGPETAPIYEGGGISPLGLGSTGGWSLQYQPEDMASGSEDLRLLTVTGSPGVPGDLEALRFWALTTQPIEIQDQDGLEYAAFDAATGPFGIAWQDTPGLIVQVVGLGLDQQAVREVTESLEEIDADEWRGLKQDAVDSGCLDSASPDGGDDLA